MIKNSYKLLIDLIRQKLEDKFNCQKEIIKVNTEANRSVHGPKFSMFADKETRENFISELVSEIKKVDDYLEQVAGRNHERHKEFVGLLVECFELEKEIESCEQSTKFAGGYLHLQKCEIRKNEINSRIEEIVSETNTCHE